MRVNVKKWGNSASVRIPASVMAAASLTVDQAVDIRAEDGRVVIEPVVRKRYNLNEMIAAMRPEHFHDPIDFGPDVGHEIIDD